MLFAKLSTNDIEIHINIAGLVIEFEPQVFPYKFSENPLYTSQNIPHLDAFQTLYESLPNYIKKNKEVFVRDSFDFFFMSTLYPMEYDETLVKGLSRVPFSVYNKRKASSLYSAVLGLVVQQKDAFGDYVIATGLIANLMDIEYEQTNEDLIPNSKKCNAIMQLNPNHCRNCLVWSEKSQQQLKKYIRSNTNRCFLLNYPRSLSPYNSRVRSMHPEDQCFCYGFDFDDMDPMYMISIPINKCGVSLKCSRIEKPGSHSIIPLDGTPCGSGYGVCWDKKCLSIKKNSNVDDCKESCPPKRQKTNHEDIGTMKEYKKY
ncbi:hypothetical protein PV327_005783 [Microctonus hyperodae]|uniref:Uncharacterized protein n=1 Tax=Microctonus hyperodae TaxID=165561 RepID=A0AA39G2E6_MICHY|nr:hypothetical protein PV327_005783 [Microctonus hyperodae]